MAVARLVGLLLETAARENTPPPKPARPIACPRCRSGDIHGARPCAHRPDLDADVSTYRHDWHCHNCRWSDRIGDAS